MNNQNDLRPRPKNVLSRRVYYLAGFDPRGAGYYHRLYREESAKQAAHHDGASISVGHRKKLGPLASAWIVDGQWNDHEVKTTYQFLHWDDLVRRHWQPSLPMLIVAAVRDYANYVKCGAFGRIRKSFRGPYLSALYPIAYLLVLAVLVPAVFFSGAALSRAAGLPPALAWACGALAGLSLGLGGLALANGLSVFWLLRTYSFVQRWGAREHADVRERIDAFAALIHEDQRVSPADEVLLIGHSVGSILAVSIAARLSALFNSDERESFTLVTLGQCIPLLSLMPSAQAFRQDLRQLAQDSAMAWLDMNARADSLCFSQQGPLDASGIDGTRRPITQVVRPFRMFEKRTYARIKRNRQRMHFQYLMASELSNEYDYFRMTAGPSRIQPF